MYFRAREDCYVTSGIERTKTASWGLAGGGPGRPNSAALRDPEGNRTPVGKITRLLVPKGWTLELHTGGGGGYGPVSERDPRAVLEDTADGYVSDTEARRTYAHVYPDTPPE
jgi:N-methylhydantoinase B